ncbi:hypothetical protein CFOL_v3_27091, partial [Cephalotus follicularis]
CNFLDLGFSGPHFTWMNYSRLDKFMSNTSWKETFPNARVVHVTRTHSDHHPILLNTMASMPLITKPS